MVGLLVVGIGLVLSQLFRLKDWLNRQPRPRPPNIPTNPELDRASRRGAAMAGRGPDWADWVRRLPAIAVDMLARWRLRPDGPPMHGHCSLVLPVRTADGAAAVLKISFPDDESGMSMWLRRWAGAAAVRLLSADPHRRAMLLERLHGADLTGLTDVDACRVVAGLYRRVHVPAMPPLRTLGSYLRRWNADLAALPRGAPIPRRLVEQAAALAPTWPPSRPRTVGSSTATCTTPTCWPPTANPGW